VPRPRRYNARMDSNTLKRRDLAALWHPCTQMKDYGEEGTLPMLAIRRGEGVWLEDFEGRRYLDAISSWWVNLFGHANPTINAAIRDQLDQLEHVILASCTHEPVVRLSERLIGLTPEPLTRCFFADNGSAAVEVALKMSFHYWKNRGQPEKQRFICLTNSYHGETLGALAVGAVELYRATYAPLMMPVITVPGPGLFRTRGRRNLCRCRATPVRADGSHPRRPRSRNRGGDHRAAGAVRGLDAHVRSRVPAIAA